MAALVKNNIGHIITIALLLIGIGVNWGTISSFMEYQKGVNAKVETKVDNLSQAFWELKGKIGK